MGFDKQRAVVASGDGVVARFPGILCVAQGSEPEAIHRLLALCTAVAGPDPGRALARRLVAWMSGPESPGDGLRFGTLASAGAHLAVFLVGEVEAWVDGPERTVLSGADAAIGTDRLLPRPDMPVVVSVGAIRLPADPADVHDLRSGVVAGAGAVLHPAHGGDILGVRGEDLLGLRHDDILGLRDDDILGLPEDDVEKIRHDWFADAGSPPEPPGPGAPAEGAGAVAATGATGAGPVHRNGLPGPANGDRRTSPAWPWPAALGSGAVLDGHVFPAPDPDVTGRHAIIDPLGPVEQVGANGHAPPVTAAPAELPSRPALRVYEGGAGEEATPGFVPDAPATDSPAPESPASEGPAVADVSAGDDTAPGGPAAGAGDPAEARNGTTTALAVPLVEQEPDTAAPQVRGYVCGKGHLNDPRAPFCGRCGATMDERAGGLVDGPRPALGRLVFDDGAIYTVDEGYLVGRMPEADDRVQAGGLRPIIVEDRSGSVSRVHAEIQIAGWDVMLLDAGSRNGTFVAGPEESGWSPLAPQRSRRLLPGTRVRLGSRTFVFESASGLR